ncbi:MAG TPA: hypothetical protein VFM69_15840 [Pricia sp.]|nr:hypothetical protein [Pricia sp.]
MTTTDIRIKGLRLIEKVVTLMQNVEDGCFSDKPELDKELPRLQAFKKWAIENDQLQEVKAFMGSKRWGMHRQFAAAEISSIFNN